MHWLTFDGVLGSWDDDMFNGIDCRRSAPARQLQINREDTSSIHNFDDLVQDHESCLQAGQLDESINGTSVGLSTSLHLLASLAQAGQAKVVDFFLDVSLKLW